MSRINIAFGITKDWLKYTLVTICSILSNAKEEDDYHFYIMSDWENTSVTVFKPYLDTLNLIKPAEYQFLKMDNSEFEGAIHDWLGVSSSYRLKLPALLKEDKVLYLDSDLIAMNDISELYSYDVSDYYLGGVEDKSSHMMRTRVKLKEGQTFINGGVQLMNLKKFREDNLEPIIFNKLKTCDYYTDQDVINDICRDKILQLPLKYNLMILDMDGFYINRQEEYKQAVQSPAIIHYTVKPWKEDIPYRDCWYKYLKILNTNLAKVLKK